MIKKTTLSLLIIILSIVVNAASLKGKIQNHNQALEYFTAAILSSQDSSILTGGAFMDGYFEFPNLKVDKCLLQISCVGYQTITKPIDFRKNSSIDIFKKYGVDLEFAKKKMLTYNTCKTEKK